MKKFKYLPAAIGLLCGFFGMAIFKVVYTDIKVSQSKYTKWDKEFKDNFNLSCVRSASSQFNTKDPEHLKVVENYSLKYCDCITHLMEGLHIIPTKYNKIDGEEKYIRDIEVAMDNYISSPVGRLQVQGCVNTAANGSKIKSSYVAIMKENFTGDCRDAMLNQVRKVGGSVTDKHYSYATKYCSCFSNEYESYVLNAVTSGEGRSIASTMTLSEIGRAVMMKTDEWYDHEKMKDIEKNCISEYKK